MTELRNDILKIPAANLGRENPLPVFRHTERAVPMKLGDSIPAEVLKGMEYGDLYRILPYRMQDGYDRDRKPRPFRSVVLENELLKAVFVPALGGRLWSLYDKENRRDLVASNPIFQPAALALRNAWFSGGVEWNTPRPGHSLLTCAPVHAARVRSASGYPVLRLYAWDRVMCVPWAIDFHLPPGTPSLFARVRLLNVHDREIPMYWWTNIAVHEIPGGRVLYPADNALTHRIGGRLGIVSLRDTMPDMMAPTNNRNTNEYYGMLDPARRPWVVQVAPDGTGMFHASTRRLKGRKMFCWGMAAGGRRWQDLLTGGHPYVEIQAGLTCTQAEQLPMPAHAEWSWVEAFGPFAAPAAAVHDRDWTRAWKAAEKVLDDLLPQARLEELDRTLTRDAHTMPEEALAAGEGWGALERRRCKVTGAPDAVPPELPFAPSELGPEQEPWLALLDCGAMPEQPPEKDPQQGMVQSEWAGLLGAAVVAGRGDHWLSWLHLGNMRMEALDRAGAAEAWRRSVNLTPNGWAYRNLAELAKREKRMEEACDFMTLAWKLGPQIAKLAIEYGQLLAHFKRFDELRTFCREVPADIRDNERIRIFAAQAAMETGALDEVEPLFAHSFATIAEGETILTDLWFGWYARRLAKREGVPLDDALCARVRKDFSPPANIDFRLVSEISSEFGG